MITFDRTALVPGRTEDDEGRLGIEEDSLEDVFCRLNGRGWVSRGVNVVEDEGEDRCCWWRTVGGWDR